MRYLTMACLGVSASVLLTACDKKEEPAAAPVAVTVPAPVTPAVAPLAAPVAAPQPPAAPAASSDPDAPTPLPALQVKGNGIKKNVSYYYAFNAGAGTVKLTATAKNAPSGAAHALITGLYDSKAKRLCYDTHGNTTTDKTVVINCTIDKAQALILRIDLGDETIDFKVALEGPVTLPPPEAAGAARQIAGPGSTDIDQPTRLETNRIKGDGVTKPIAYYYAFHAGPGELTLTVDGKNLSAAATEAVTGGIYTLRSERLCEISLGNTTIDKRGVVACKVDKRQPVILRLDLTAETVDFRARFEGPYDFEPFTAPNDVTIALDANVLFDTGKFELKEQAQKTLHEAAERVKKFPGAAVMISGHTDSTGKEASNKVLSDQRAAAVRDYFVNRESVPAGGLSVKGFGKSEPVADNGSEEGRARNRRVDVVIKPAAK